MAEIGYVRVSTVGQNTARQLDGLELDELFEEKASATTRHRPKLEECLRYVRKGDTLHVHSIDRLARNLGDLLHVLELLLKKQVTVEFHKEHLRFDTGESPFQTLQLQIIGAVAQFEREIIRERQREGIAKAQASGRHCGRRPKLSAKQKEELKRRCADGEKKAALAEEYGVSRQTVYRQIKSND
ncbi:recombinase family protein (plasmid) [Desulfobaculum bizertense]|uniref:recombinase family protein n=1 Tax=Desulfobaculum bizertense TaxID=376490 RepID=UPI001F3B7BD0|nr:recombinase family protein [Desulfobaculum bizertense]UIJ39565.1 recombinase family protein [Desulfobaculum bizertense]UIJ39568.1 recombinase family protein [Desulfobaculum bizertense]